MRELKGQFGSALLVVLIVATVVAAAINFQQNFQQGKRYELPEDGVVWVDRTQKDGSNAVVALHVTAGSPADNNGIVPGDRLVAIEAVNVQRAADVAEVLVGIGVYNRAYYTVERGGFEIRPRLVIEPRTPDTSLYYQYAVGAAYLVIGLFVIFRRGSAPKALHFLILCIVSFALSSFHYTGKLNNFDKIMYWGNFAAGLFAPTIFLHFCLTFPAPRQWLRRRALQAVLYLPAAAFFAVVWGIAGGWLRIPAINLIELRWLIDRLQMGFLSALYLLGAIALHAEYRRTEDAIVRQQLKWLRNGALFGIVPFTVLYVAPYLMGAMPAAWMKLSVLTLPLVPLTWAYAIVRYRLMDVDVIFQQGYAYTLATLAVLGVFYGLFFGLHGADDLSPGAAAILILVAAFVFQPIRNWIQELLDRHVFYKDRYDYRLTLVEFARELSSETDIDKMLDSVAERLTHTLSVRQIAFFLAGEDEGTFRLHRLHGHRSNAVDPATLDLRFLRLEQGRNHLFFERTRHIFDAVMREMPPAVRQTIADLDLTYYLPCTVRGRIIAWLGVSRTEEGDFLSSDDVELLLTLSGYLGIAIENARLYHSLQRKVDEYERLKEFSENIVESISVGIFAVDLEDRVESWNSQIEQLTCIPRHVAVGQPLSRLFPPDLCARFNEVREQSGIHNVYKMSYRPMAHLPFALSGHGSNGNGAGVNGTNGHRLESDRELTVNIAIAPLVSRELKQIGRLILIDDITERSELEARLMQSDKLSSIGMLAAGVAHEVNTPLAVISTYSQMLAKQVSGDEQKSRLLEKIARQTFRASEIVNSLLNFSRTSRTEFEPVDLNRVINETISLVSHQMEKSGVRVELNLARTLPPIRGNSNRLQQVFLNLVLNARDAMASGGSLSVRSWSEGDAVCAEVADTGEGIAPEHVARIYDPFFTTKAASRKGTGLGLSVTYGIVQEHGGTIDVQSERGAGTLFHLEFPRMQRPTAASATAAASADSQQEVNA